MAEPGIFSLKASRSEKLSLDFKALPPDMTTLAESSAGFSDLMISSLIIWICEGGSGLVFLWVFWEMRSGFESGQGAGGFGKFVFRIPRKIASYINFRIEVFGVNRT